MSTIAVQNVLILNFIHNVFNLIFDTEVVICILDKSDLEAFSRPFKIAKISIKKILKKSIYEHYEKQLTEKLSLINDSSILFLYSKLKSDIKLEEYLKRERTFKNRQLLIQFRLSDHNL